MLNRTIQFIKTTIVGGLVVIIPVTILVIILGVLFDSLASMAETLADFIPFGALGDKIAIMLLAALGVVLLCFTTGLMLASRPGKALAAFFERRISRRIPLLGLIRNLTSQFVGDRAKQFQPVEVDIHGTGAWVPAFLVDKHTKGRLAIFVPGVPVVTIGKIYYVPEERVREIDASAMDVINVIGQWGVGSSDLSSRRTKP